MVEVGPAQLCSGGLYAQVYCESWLLVHAGPDIPTQLRFLDLSGTSLPLLELSLLMFSLGPAIKYDLSLGPAYSLLTVE